LIDRLGNKRQGVREPTSGSPKGRILSGEQSANLQGRFNCRGAGTPQHISANASFSGCGRLLCAQKERKRADPGILKMVLPFVPQTASWQPEGKACPQFRNDLGLREIRIGVKAFECIGETPPQDHRPVYLELGSLGQILSPIAALCFVSIQLCGNWRRIRRPVSAEFPANAGNWVRTANDKHSPVPTI
jgi:uncharacterized Zn-finger protein